MCKRLNKIPKTELPKEIVNLTNLTELFLEGRNLILTQSQKQWIDKLKENSCDVED